VCVCIVLYCILLNASVCVVAGKAETGRRQPEPWSTGDGGQCACSVAAPVGGTSSGGSELSSTSSSDLISEDWFLRFSEYRLEDYYAVQATIRSVASPRAGLGWTCPPHFCWRSLLKLIQGEGQEGGVGPVKVRTDLTRQSENEANLLLSLHTQKLKGFQLQGDFAPPDQELCPWTPLEAPPTDPRYMLRARHVCPPRIF